ncbi:MAG: FxLYD domain-containing protein [Rhodothermaceae bacterium]|nr:FxLYD domain-containing protein [Rhodothermaceae bacterium]
MRYLIAVCILFFALGGCQPTGNAAERQPLEVEDLKYSLLPGGARIVTGNLYNPSAESVRNAQIQISLFDGDNRKISSMNVVIKDIPPGERKSFREAVDVDLDVRGAKVKRVIVL